MVFLICKQYNIKHAGTQQSSATIHEPSTPSPDRLETKPRLLVLCRELEVLSQHWREIGEFLELAKEELDKVESQHSSTPSRCMRGMFMAWLSREHPRPTWKVILEVVEYLNPQLALKLKHNALAYSYYS